MEVEHFVGIAAALIVSVLLVWIVWSCFCHDKTELQDEEYDPAGDSFSSTQVITSRRRGGKGGHGQSSSGNSGETTDEEEDDIVGQGGQKGHKAQPPSAYRYQTNKYGLDDPFGEWRPKPKLLEEPGSVFSPVYPKSPALRHKAYPKDESLVIDI